MSRRRDSEAVGEWAGGGLRLRRVGDGVMEERERVRRAWVTAGGVTFVMVAVEVEEEGVVCLLRLGLGVEVRVSTSSSTISSRSLVDRFRFNGLGVDGAVVEFACTSGAPLAFAWMN